MIILDKPYVSDFFLDTIKSNGFPVLRNNFAIRSGLGDYYNLIPEEDAIKSLLNKENPLVYMPSENPLAWVMNNLQATRLPATARLFKDKVESRKLLRLIYPDYFFQEVALGDLDEVDISGIAMPFVIKPSVGFFSLAVCRVDSPDDWEPAKREIRESLDMVRSLFPSEVVDPDIFIIEEFIQGEEFAFDAYFNQVGEPIVLSAYKHVFASPDDVTDRLYVTSADIVRKYEPVFRDFLESLGGLAELRNFPLHVEVRIDSQGRLLPIEINPMRFGGMCTTADLAFHAYGYNLYEYCFGQRKPDWEELLRGRDDYVYGLVVLNNSTGIEPHKIRGFDYNGLVESFEHVLELRKVDHREFHFFGFVFIESRKDNYRELGRILRSDLREYISG